MSASHSPTLDEQQRYREWWQEARSINEWSLKHSESILTFLRSLTLDHPKILDLGCGTGWFTEKLAHFGQATGVNLSEKAMTTAKSRFPHITFLSGNFFEIPFPAEHFDVVVSRVFR